MDISKECKTEAENTIVAFHIGRGGHFWNPGHRTYCGEHKIGEYTENLFLNYDLDQAYRLAENNITDAGGDWDTEDTEYHEKIFMTNKQVFEELVNDEDFEEIEKRFGVSEEEFGEQRYCDGSGNEVGLTYSEEESGIGCINIDHDYDTTYTCKLSDCSEEELRCILRSEREFSWLSESNQSYVRYILDEEIEEEEIEEEEIEEED